MEHELVVRAISHSIIGLLIIALLLLLLLGIRREIDGGSAIHGIVQFGPFLMGLFTFIALMSVYFQATRLVVRERISEHMDTVSAQHYFVSATSGIRLARAADKN
jgi:hypothetical protein